MPRTTPIRACLPVSDRARARNFYAFVESVKTCGFVAQAPERHGIRGATVAPAART